MPLLSATLIVRDEERHLAACLRSVQGFVDETVVVDTGSRDRTREIALAQGARMIEAQWEGDFSAARNLALEHARGDWVLYIDADERASGGQELRRTLEAPSAVAGRVRFRVRAGFTRYWEHRLFRNDPSIRFQGVIHETVVPDILDRVREGQRVVDTDLALDHLGYEGDLSAKHQRDIPLLERAVREDPGRIYLWYALGAACLELGDRERALEAWMAGLAPARHRTGGSMPGLVLLAAITAEQHRRGLSAAEWVEEAATEFAEHPLVSWMLGREAIITGRPADAVRHFERLVQIDPDVFIDSGVGMDRRIFREGAYELLGVCWLRLGDPLRAAEWLRRAEGEMQGPCGPIRIKRELAESRARRAAGGGTE